VLASAASLRDRLRASSLTVGIAGGSAFDALADNIADTAARNLPIISGSAGYTYRYNPQLEIFERTSETSGRCSSSGPIRSAAGSSTST